MATARDVLADTRHYLMSNKPDRINQLNNNISAGASSLALKHEARGISEGTRLGIDLEEFHVIKPSGTAPGDAIEVIPGFSGSTPTSHLANAMVLVGPAFTNWRIARYINEALEELSAEGLFQIKPLTFTYVPSRSGYDINAPDMIDIWRVKYAIPGPTRAWPIIPHQAWTLDMDADTSDFPSGKSLTLDVAGYPGHAIRVSYKAGFTPLFDFTTFNPATDYDIDLSTTGLHPEAHGLVAKSAAISMLGGREVKRTLLDTQPEPRRQEEVPVGGASQAIRPLLQMFQDELNRERRRLKRRYPEQI